MHRWQTLVVVQWIVIAALAVLLLSRTDRTADATPGAALSEAVRTPERGTSQTASTRSESRGPANAIERTAIVSDSSRFRDDDPAGLILSGTIRSASGEPLPDATLYISHKDAKQGEGRSALVRSVGYVVAGLTPGEQRIYLRCAGHRVLQQTFELPAAPARQTRDFVLQRSMLIAVRIVTEDATEIYAALRQPELQSVIREHQLRVQAFSRVPPLMFESRALRGVASAGTWYEATSMSRGEKPPIEIPQDCSGVLDAGRDPPCWVVVSALGRVLGSAEIRGPTERVEIPVSIRDLRASYGSIKAQFVEATTGAPITQGTLRSSLHDEGSIFERRGSPDAEGRVSLTKVAPGTHELWFHGGAELGFQQTVVLEPGGERDLGVVRARAAIKIRGTVLGTDGKPSPANLSTWSVDRPEIGFSHFGVDATTGGFEVWSYTPARKVYAASTNDSTGAPGCGYAIVDEEHAPPEPITIRMKASTRVDIEVQGSDIDAFGVAVLAENGACVAHGVAVPAHACSLFLPIGKYTLELSKAGRVVVSRPIEVGATTLRITMP